MRCAWGFHKKTKWFEPEKVRLLSGGEGHVQRRKCRRCNKFWERLL